MKYLADLRFVIGCFFTIVSGLLFIASATSDAADADLNAKVGGFMLVFALLMMTAGIRAVTRTTR